MQVIDFQIEEEQEFDDMGSFNHSLVQGNLAHLFNLAGNFSVLVELSLDSSSLDRTKYNVKDEMIPDVCIYPKRSLIPFDVLRMQEMPLLVVEVISPRQWSLSLVEKFAAYFALGVQSCWLVDPVTEVVHVYKGISDHKTFADGNVVDEMVGIEFPVAAIFD